MLSKFLKAKTTKINKLEDYVFDYTFQDIKRGKKTIQQMSPIKAQYNDFVVTKKGYLVACIKASGINLDLMNEQEQEDVFDDYNAFLMSKLGEGTDEEQQYLDITTPVNLNDYVLYWKSRYLEVMEQEPENIAKITLVASYLDHYSKLQSTNEMTTKQHIIVLHQKILKNNLPSLEKASSELQAKVISFQRSLEDSLSSYDMETHQLTASETRDVLQHLINFSNH